MELFPVHTPPGFDPHTLLTPLAAALAGEGPAVAPHSDEHQSFNGDLPNDEIAAVLSTSGSTGTPKQTMLSVDALAASAMGTAYALKSEGQWLLTLPVQYVAGFQVLVRSLYAGTRPWTMDLTETFSPERFTEAAGELTDKVRFTSLVPTQLHRLLEDPAPDTIKALQRFNAILLGGAAVTDALRSRARAHGLKIVRTYGMSETCGGCVYDGVPLEGVQLTNEDGRLWISGPVLADGYLGQPDLTREKFPFNSGRRWFRTDDDGTIDGGVLTVHGRVDDVIITGGLKVSAVAVSSVLEGMPGVSEALVLGVPHPEWGAQVAAAVVGSVNPDAVRQHAQEHLGSHAAPRIVLTLDKLPMLPNGKPDRMAVRALFEQSAL
ncbi:AMP-dependent synthetase [Arthrobacter sp. Soil782]|uniref:o-succinylbenzoate--CoA ligase n=1 Tax=Arthrobacter sp. Soil782 TaxID=1736410 RepID=UPI0007008B94|nr:o-succinylbenzoate--CoA ligase [Arthrobacter sp. Soil782]KRF08261.1 AMP-dependent synthetase [Arthrobacter sp. Soil782]